MNQPLMSGVFRTRGGKDLLLRILRIQMFPLDLSDTVESRGVGLFESGEDGLSVRIVTVYRQDHGSGEVLYIVGEPLFSEVTFEEMVRETYRVERPNMTDRVAQMLHPDQLGLR